MTAIEVTSLRKTYGSRPAVAGIDLSVPHGEVFALLGPNGAGKTTTVEILEGHRRRDSGDVRVLGQDPATGGWAWIGIVLQSATDAPDSPRPATICVSSPPNEWPTTAGCLSSLPMTSA
jgi:ABC-2 type transport system ATP-binding protein